MVTTRSLTNIRGRREGWNDGVDELRAAVSSRKDVCGLHQS